MANADDRIDTYARLAWLKDYRPVFRMEAELNGAAEEVQTLASAYRLRQLGRDDEEATEAYEASLFRISAVQVVVDILDVTISVTVR